MRTFVTGMVFMSTLAAALYWVIIFTGGRLEYDENFRPVADAREHASLARFEPSSPEVVSRMLSIARVTKYDIVYDLGCGDGRIVIAAARTTGARGVGVDMDPELISESRANAEKAKVTHLVQFIEQDLVTTDISKATVVMLYLSPEANLMLRPKLLRELKPGTRIVSHCHGMGEWKPDMDEAVNNHRVYSWIVPSDLSGKWKLFSVGKEAPDDAWIEFSQMFQDIAAGLTAGNVTIPVSRALLKGRILEFTMDREWGPIEAGARFTGRVEGDVIRGKFISKSGSGGWSAKRIR
jgi:SAM-dependent methyltransferase